MKVDNISNKDKENKKRVILILLLIIFALLTAALSLQLLMGNGSTDLNNTDVNRTAVIVAEDEPLTDTSGGEIRIKINPYVIVKEETMQDLYFSNLNESRYLQCKIKVGENYVYDSKLLAEGETIQGDLIDTGKLKSGENKALAEIYSYDLEKNMIGQTNVNITIKY